MVCMPRLRALLDGYPSYLAQMRAPLMKIALASEVQPGAQGFVYVPEYDDAALMEAIYSRGPVAVSLDASQPGFRFYADGGPARLPARLPDCCGALFVLPCVAAGLPL